MNEKINLSLATIVAFGSLTVLSQKWHGSRPDVDPVTKDIEWDYTFQLCQFLNQMMRIL